MHLNAISIRQATSQDTGKVSDILREAAQWLEKNDIAMWREDELLPSRIAPDVEAGFFFIAECADGTAGVAKFQLEDKRFWPEATPGESAFIHRLAVRRRFAGGEISSIIFNWAIERATLLHKRYLRLDCDASRPKLRSVYERFGFVHHSDRQVGPYYVSRYEYRLASGGSRNGT